MSSFVDAFRDALCGPHRTALRLLFSKVVNNASDGPLVMPHQIYEIFKEVCTETTSMSGDSSVGRLIRKIQEAVCGFPLVAMACRVDMGVWQFICLNMEDMEVEEVAPASYLALKEKLAGNVASAIHDPFVLEFDMRPFTKVSPKVSLKSSIGNGTVFFHPVALSPCRPVTLPPSLALTPSCSVLVLFRSLASEQDFDHAGVR